MTLYDAYDVKALVQNEWSLSYPNLGSTSENVVNGGFESGSTGWTGGTVVTTYYHTGTHSLKLGYTGSTYQSFAGIAVSVISEFSLWLINDYSDSEVPAFITLTYSDASTSTDTIYTSKDAWTQYNLLSYLTAGKTLVKITIANIADSGNIYVDDVSLQTTIVADLYLQLDEYTPVQPDYQIVFINTPERVMFVAPNVIKHEMDVTLQVYQKLPHYQNDDIETTYRPRQLAMKNELTRIMNTYRFNTIAQGVTINHSSWRDSKFPHGLGSEAEPISFLSTMSVQLHWYEAVREVSGDITAIGIRVAEVSIMGGDLLGVMGVDWKDTDPWVMLQVPKGPVLEQHLLGPHVEGTITCHDYHSIYTQLQTIPITIGGTQYPVNIDSSKTVFNTVNNGLPEPYPQFSIFMEDAYGAIIEYQVVNARIRNIELTRATTTGMSPISWTIRWMADYLYVVPPSGS